MPEGIRDNTIDARINALRANLARYQALLATQLTEYEHYFVERRIEEQQLLLEKLQREQSIARAPVLHEAPQQQGSRT
jgi:hypothetical protein